MSKQQILAKLRLAGLGAESYDNPLDENAEGFIATGDESETASAAILEVTKESAEIDEDLADFDNTEEAIDDIDEQADLAEIAVELNQYTPHLAMIQSIALKNALSKVAPRADVVKMVDNDLFPANESFENGNGGDLAVESLKETAAGLWTSLKAQFKAIMDKIIAFLKGVFDAATKLENRANKLKSVTKNAKAGKVKVSGAKTLMVGDKLGTHAIAGLNILLEAVNMVTNESNAALSLSALTVDAKEAEIISFTGGVVPGALKSVAPEGADVTCSKEACGGIVLASIKGKGDDAIKDTFNLVHRTPAKSAPEDSEALTAAEATHVITTVISVAKAVTRGKAVAAKFESFVKQFNANIDKVSKDDDKEKQAATRKKLTGGMVYARRVTSFRKDVISAALAASNAMCNYVEVSCKGDDTKEKKEGTGE